MSRAGRPLYGIDAGGSGTSVRAFDGERWSLPPVNPSSVGRPAADRGLSQLFGRIRGHAAQAAGDPAAGYLAAGDPAAGDPAAGDPAAGLFAGRGSARPAIWLASAAIDPAAARQETRRIEAAARAAGLSAEIVVSNDVTPLILLTPPGVGHVVAVCGTGAGFLATDGRSAPARVGGCEYLGSDEGSAFDLGLRGLRAAVRGLDGRAQRTALSGLLAAAAGASVPELARRLARTPFPKSEVAALAPVVLRAWLGGDQAAAGLVEDAIGELVLGVRAARDAAAVPGLWRLSAAGGVVTGCPEFFGALASAAAGLGADPVELISDPAAAVLAALDGLARTDPIVLADPRIDRDAWHLDLAEPCRPGPAGRTR